MSSNNDQTILTLEVSYEKMIHFLVRAATHEDISTLDSKIAKLDSKIDRLEEKFDRKLALMHEATHEDISKLDSKIDRLEEKFDHRLEKLDEKYDKLFLFMIASIIMPILLTIATHFLK